MSLILEEFNPFNNIQSLHSTAPQQHNANMLLGIPMSNMEKLIQGVYMTHYFVHSECDLLAQGFTHIITIDKHIREKFYPMNILQQKTGGVSDVANVNVKNAKGIEILDLNFGERTYLATVLPNCYRAVNFIDKALRSGGNILLIDCIGGAQKCITVTVAYLMYKHNISFKNAFALLKQCYVHADLDRYYASQLYEYEPILQVQRSSSRGHSCSRKLHAAILKRKKTAADDDVGSNTTDAAGESTHSMCLNKNEFFDALNPLSHFNAANTDQSTQRLPSTLPVAAATATQQQLLDNNSPTAQQQQQFFPQKQNVFLYDCEME